MAAAASSRVGLIGTGMRKCEEGAKGMVMASGDVQYLCIEASVCVRKAITFGFQIPLTKHKHTQFHPLIIHLPHTNTKGELHFSLK